MKNPYVFVLITGIIMIISGCSVSNHSMKYPNYHIEFYKSDFEYSPQVTAEATSVRVLGIDWNRLFNWQTGSLQSDRFDGRSQNIVINGAYQVEQVAGAISAVVPVLGDYQKGRVSAYALYKLMEENPGYDVVIYPQYESKKFIVPLFYSKRVVKVTARLGRIN